MHASQPAPETAITERSEHASGSVLSAIPSPYPTDHPQAVSAADFDALEQRFEQTMNQPEVINELADTLLDYGLILASDAGQRGLTRLQESWLRRVYRTLLRQCINTTLPAPCRTACANALYQVAFALRHLYAARPGGERSLRTLMQEMQFIDQPLG